jgi:RNA polymerase sigma-70 factor (ECF subfamily)
MTALEFNYAIVSEQKSLYNFARNLVNDKDDAQDLVQETFLKALRHREKFTDSSNLKAWMFTILKNTYINQYRKLVKGREINNEATKVDSYSLFKQKNTDTPDQNINYKELMLMVETLSDTYKIPFTRHYEGYSYEEIAEELNLPLGTVKSRIFWARKTLSTKLNSKKFN